MALVISNAAANAQAPPELLVASARVEPLRTAEEVAPLGGNRRLADVRFKEAEAVAPLSLPEALFLTLQNNPQRASALASLQAAQSRIGAARANSGLQVGLSGSAGYDKSYGGGGGPNAAFFQNSQGERRSLGVNADIAILDGGRNKANKRAVEASARGEAAQTLQIEQQLIRSTLTAYLEVLRNDQLLEVAENNLSVSRERRRVAGERLRVGSGARLDVLSANTELAAAQQGRIDAANNLAQAKSTLNILMGRMPETPVRLMPVTALTPRVPLAVISGTPNAIGAQLRTMAEDANPSLAMHRAAVDSAVANITVAEAQRKPQVSFGLSNVLSSPVQAAGRFLLSLGLSASQSLFDSGRARSQIAEARALSDQARQNLSGQRLVVAGEIDAALLAYDSAQERLVNADEAVMEAKQALRAAQAGYAAGARTSLELSDAQSGLLSAQTNAANARFDVANGQAQVSAAVGVMTDEGQKAYQLALGAQELEERNRPKPVRKR